MKGSVKTRRRRCFTAKCLHCDFESRLNEYEALGAVCPDCGELVEWKQTWTYRTPAQDLQSPLELPQREGASEMPARRVELLRGRLTTDEILESISTWVGDKGQLTAVERKQLLSILDGHRTKIKVWLAGVGTAYVGRVQRWLQIATDLEDELFDPAAIEDLSHYQKIELYTLLGRRIDTAVKFVADLAKSETQVVVSDVLELLESGAVEISGEPAQATPQQRESVRTLFRRLESDLRRLKS